MYVVNPRTYETETVDISKFKANLVFTVSSRPAMVTL